MKSNRKITRKISIGLISFAMVITTINLSPFVSEVKAEIVDEEYIEEYIDEECVGEEYAGEEYIEVTDVFYPAKKGIDVSLEDYLERRLLDELPEDTSLVSYGLSCDEYNDNDYSYNYSKPVTYGNFGLSDAAQFNDCQKALYTYLRSEFEKIANGSSNGSTQIECVIENAPVYTPADLGYSANLGQAAFEKFNRENVDKVLDALLQDCPYELYWYDKTVGVKMNGTIVSISEGLSVSRIIFSFTVNEYYRFENDRYRFDNDKVSDVNTAIDNAIAIVEKYKNKSDYEKLKGYLTEICDLTEYNKAALEEGYSKTNMNPWQMIYVFDGNPDTKVVCEGYAKAFQYLCDLTTFSSSVTSYIVTGTMHGSKGPEGHMWNVVSIGSKNYIVDVTNCDGDSIGNPDMLFLAGLEKDEYGTYIFTRDERNQVAYVYDIDIVYLYGEDILTLASENYVSDAHVHEFSDDTCQSVCACGAKNVDGNHNFSDTDYLYDGNGKHYQICSLCEIESEHVECIPGDVEKKDIIAPTCGKAGSHNDVVYCTKCSRKMSSTTVTDPATEEHTYTKYVSIGNGKHKIVCKYCNIVRAGHEADSCSGGTATCTAKAKCSKCKAEYGSLVAHTLKTTTTKATPTANGKKETKCTVCGKVTKTTTIYAAKTIKLSSTKYTYDGQVKKPSVTIKDSKGNAIANTNYTVTYPSGRKNVGKYTVKITFKGDYSGSKSLAFTINPPKTSISSTTAKSKSFVVKWAKKTTQITGYEIQYSTSKTFESGNKTAKVTSANTVSKTITNLKAKKTYYVRVRTYKTVGTTKYYSAWSSSKAVTTK